MVTGIGEGGEDRRREWMRMGRKSSWEGEQWICSTGKGGKVKEVRIGIKKIVMVKLQYKGGKTARYRNNKQFSLLVKVLELFLRTH
jgi:hypothetical protein